MTCTGMPDSTQTQQRIYRKIHKSHNPPDNTRPSESGKPDAENFSKRYAGDKDDSPPCVCITDERPPEIGQHGKIIALDEVGEFAGGDQYTQPDNKRDDLACHVSPCASPNEHNRYGDE